MSLSSLLSLKLWGFPYLHMAEVFKAMAEVNPVLPNN